MPAGKLASSLRKLDFNRLPLASFCCSAADSDCRDGRWPCESACGISAVLVVLGRAIGDMLQRFLKADQLRDLFFQRVGARVQFRARQLCCAIFAEDASDLSERESCLLAQGDWTEFDQRLLIELASEPASGR